MSGYDGGGWGGMGGGNAQHPRGTWPDRRGGPYRRPPPAGLGATHITTDPVRDGRSEVSKFP